MANNCRIETIRFLISYGQAGERETAQFLFNVLVQEGS